jgi:hypothetical protein
VFVFVFVFVFFGDKLVYVVQGVADLVTLLFFSLEMNVKPSPILEWFVVKANSIEYWTPVIIYCLLCFIYATQVCFSYRYKTFLSLNILYIYQK